MGTEQDKERLFIHELDRLLAGNEPKTGPDADADLRSALEFARKMTEIRRQPDPVFSARLKAALLQKLAAQEEKEAEAKERSWFRRLILRNPAWQAATAVLVLLMIFGIAWAAGHFNQTQPLTVSVPSPTSASTTSAPAAAGAGILLEVGASTDKSVYSAGEDVNITVRLTNINSQTIQLDQFPPLSLMRADTQMPEYTFAALNDARTLAPYETASYTFDWNQTDFKGAPAPSGTYYVELEDLDYQGRSIQLNLSQPVTFNILPKY